MSYIPRSLFRLLEDIDGIDYCSLIYSAHLCGNMNRSHVCSTV